MLAFRQQLSTMVCGMILIINVAEKECCMLADYTVYAVHSCLQAFTTLQGQQCIVSRAGMIVLAYACILFCLETSQHPVNAHSCSTRHI